MANSNLDTVLGGLFSPVNSEQRTCDQHGEYTASLIKLPGNRQIWTACPVCDQERVKQEDRRMMADLHAERQKSRMEAMLGRAAIPKRFMDRSLDNYRVELDGQKRAHSSATRFIENWEDALSKGTSLIMCGNPGTGKTHLAVGIARKVMDMGHTALFTRVIDIARAVKETYSRECQRTERQVIADFVRPDLLILDEVGHQHGSDTERLILFDVINARYEQCKPMILITNLSLNGLREYLDERAQDRLREGDGRVIVFDWASQRGNL